MVGYDSGLDLPISSCGIPFWAYGAIFLFKWLIEVWVVLSFRIKYGMRIQFLQASDYTRMVLSLDEYCIGLPFCRQSFDHFDHQVIIVIAAVRIFHSMRTCAIYRKAVFEILYAMNRERKRDSQDIY